MRSVMTPRAGRDDAGIHVKMRERVVRFDIRILDVREARSVTALTLHIVIRRIGHRRVARRMADGIAEL